MARHPEPVPLEAKVRVFMQIAVSLGSFALSVAILSAPNWFVSAAPSKEIQLAATGWVGIMVGYWLS